MAKRDRNGVPFGVLSVTFLSFIVLLSGCSGFPSRLENKIPHPSKIQDSLLVIFYETRGSEYEGEEVVSLTIERKDGKRIRHRQLVENGGVVTVKLKPESYLLRSVTSTFSRKKSEDRLRSRSSLDVETNFIIGASTVLLYESKIVNTPDSLELQPLEGTDRRLAAESLAERISFLYWSGGSYVGFGPHSPDSIFSPAKYTVSLDSDPGNAAVFIDGEEYGVTPLSTELPTGKHMVRIAFSGGREERKMITVPQDGKIFFTAPEDSSTGEGESSGSDQLAMVAPFLNEGDGDYDYLSTVFSDTLGVTLSGYENLRSIILTSSRRNRMDLLFEAAEEAGAALLIEGSFRANEEEVLVRSIVYDVKTEMAKTSTLYVGSAGLNLFDSIDEMAETFAAEVDRVLPEIGEKVIRLVEERDEETLRFNRRVASKKIAAIRFGKRIMVDAGAAFGSSFLERDYGTTEDVYRGNETFWAPLVSLTYLPLPYIGLNITTGYEALMGATENDKPFEIPLIAGPLAFFPSDSFDIYFGILPHLAYCSAYTSTETDVEYDPLWRGDLLVDWGVYLYHYGRRDEPIRYLKIDLQFNIIGGTWNSGFGDFQKAGMNSRIYLSFGRRL